MTTTFKSQGWTVKFDATADPDETCQWVVCDAEGDEYDWLDNEKDAIDLCKDKAMAEAKERLWTTITEETDIDAVSLETLHAVAKLLGLKGGASA